MYSCALWGPTEGGPRGDIDPALPSPVSPGSSTSTLVAAPDGASIDDALERADLVAVAALFLSAARALSLGTIAVYRMTMPPAVLPSLNGGDTTCPRDLPLRPAFALRAGTCAVLDRIERRPLSGTHRTVRDCAWVRMQNRRLLRQLG